MRSKINSKLSITILTLALVFYASNLAIGSEHDLSEKTGVNLSEEIANAFKKIVGRISYAFQKIDAWLDRVFGFNFTKLIQLIGRIIVWFLELVVKFVKWVIELVV